jgi:hypothetical protein
MLGAHKVATLYKPLLMNYISGRQRKVIALSTCTGGKLINSALKNGYQTAEKFTKVQLTDKKMKKTRSSK